MNLKIFIINLDEDTERYERTCQNLISSGFQKSHFIRVAGIKEKFGMIGCAMSHVKALEIAKSHTSISHFIILEDDFNFSLSKNTITMILRNLCKLDLPWNVWQLYASRAISRKMGVLNFNQNLQIDLLKIIASDCCAAYLVKREFLNTLQDSFSKGLKVFEANKNYYINKSLFLMHREKYSTDQVWKELQGLGNFIGVDCEVGRLRETYSHLKKQVRKYSDGSYPNFLGMNKFPFGK